VKTAIAIIIIFTLCLSGCNFIGDISESTPEKHLITAYEIEKIEENMLYNDAVSILGPGHKSYASDFYPFAPTWELESGGELTVIFAVENDKEFQNELDEAKKSGGNILDVYAKWKRTSKAVRATVSKNGEMKVLFGDDWKRFA